MVGRRKQHNVDRFLLSIFDGSPTLSAKAWVKELDTFLQQHQISKEEVIRVAALHFGGKVHGWWLFESFSLKNENNSSYAMFIRALMGKFGGKKSKTHMEETNIPRKTKPLHMMGEFMGSRSLQKPLEEVDILHGYLLEARPSS